MKRYNSTILIILLFVIDCVTGNFPEVIGYKNPETNIQWWYEFVVPFMIGKWLFLTMPYVILLGWSINSSLKKPIRFIWEFPDFLMILVCMASCLKTYWDWKYNNNEMLEWMDWSVFIITFILLIILKLSWRKLQKHIGRIRAL